MGSGRRVLWNFCGNSLKSARLLGGLELNQTVETEKVKNLFAGERQQEAKEQQADATNEREKSLKKDAVENQLPILELSSADFVTKEIVYKENRELADEEAMQFVNTLSVEELIDLAAGDPGKAQGGNLGAAGISVPGSAGETHRCAIEKGLASIVLADGPLVFDL